MQVEAIEEDPSQNLASYRKQGYASMIVACLSVAFAFVEVDYRGIFKVLGYFLLIPYQLEQDMEFDYKSVTSFLVDL